MESRSEKDLLEWLESVGHGARRLERMTGDVSHRAYYRVDHGRKRTSVLAVYPKDQRPVCARFATTTRLLGRAGVPSPEIHLNDCSRGLALLEDVGDRTLYDLRDQQDRRRLDLWIETAAEISATLAGMPPGPIGELNPPLDAPLLRRELDQTWTALLEPRGLTGRGAGRRQLRRALDELCEALGEGPRVVCHRDFMARNLVPGGDGRLRVLDHQDLRLGPLGYDLASLLNDSLFAPPELEERLLSRHLPADREARRRYRRCVVQRTLKAAGTFAVFAARGFTRHLPLIPPSLARAAAQLRSLPEGDELDSNLLQAWSSFELDR